MSDSDSSSSDEELEAYHQMYESLGGTKNGGVTLEELVRLEKDRSDQRGSVFDEYTKREELKRFMAAGDMDRDEKLSFDEFVAAMRKRAHDVLDDSDSDMDSRHMRSRSGSFQPRKKGQRRKSSTTKPVPGYLKAAGISPAEYLRWQLEKDHIIDVQSFDTRAALRRAFDCMDSNTDGLIVKTELLEAKQHFVSAGVRPPKDFKVSGDPGVATLASAFEEYLSGLFEKNSSSHDSLVAVDFNQYLNIITALRFTHGQMVDFVDRTLWSRQQTDSSLNISENTPYQDLTGALSTLRRQLMKVQTENPTEDYKSQSPEQLQHALEKAQQQLNVALHVADALGEKCKQLEANSSGKRSHAERNKEFFYLTALACKLNYEARAKASKKQPPPFPQTKELYEAAMKARVPFQYYAKWLDKQVLPEDLRRGSIAQGAVPKSVSAQTVK